MHLLSLRPRTPRQPQLRCRRAAWLVGLALGLAIASPQPAHPCSPPPSGCSRALYGAWEESPVYTNDRISISLSCFDADPPSTPWPVLLDESGQEIPSVWEPVGETDWVRTGPELPAGTRITVRDHWTTFCFPSYAADGGDWDGDGLPEPRCDALEEGELRDWRVFVTADGPDITPPPTPSPPGFRCDEVHETTPLPCGGRAEDTWWADAEAQHPQDPTLHHMEIFFRREGEAYDLSRPGAGGPGLGTPPSERPGIWFAAARAVDRAGNKSPLSAETRFVFPNDCDFEVPYPTGDVPDAPLGGGDPAAMGCSSARGGGAVLALAMLFICGCILVRQKRSGRFR